jgi:hypothetical protein
LTSPRIPKAIIPKNAVSPMAASDVAVASAAAKPARRIRSGTITVPPPTPKRALKNPAAIPIPMNTALDGRAGATAVFSR